ncbi:carbohydrate kinase [Hymenobacter taeanensis]|uniref:Carbohydrate kinase n=1 Tax=Hymenobacter taeanensis TaxID=2735321 RepID=A0A6M6BLT2_9BACT|nr:MULTISPECIES: FGGY family carbohydrate kinase [Hymenobacter]QJX48937.1 carbohydrate kinase [Hymenobacter taeanensis]UOQ81548.1 FGGY family carbohydrate kinase [Hymenobacter sp. 5414T-23]
MKYLLGFDIGSSSIKVALLSAETGTCLASVTSPKKEMEITVEAADWAEQRPERWWQEAINATQELRHNYGFDTSLVAGIGITYQMHGLVLLNEQGKVLRPAIIWCDSRAVDLGNQAFAELGEEHCLSNYLNSPGNFTASKLKWVKENEPAIYAQIHKIQLPGDYIAYQMTGQMQTTVSGLSEGVFWNFREQAIAQDLLDYYGISRDLLPEVVATFSEQGRLTAEAAQELGLHAGTPISYRAGDQPNNAFSLNVLHAGEIAATAGTSGVVYGISETPTADPRSRVNAFVHVNSTQEQPKNGVLMCMNGTGILNSWLRKVVGEIPYDEMNQLAAQAPVGAEGLVFLPFGNGAERILENRPTNAELRGLNFNVHSRSHVLRAAQEGIVFALNYGIDIMRQSGVQVRKVRAGNANMFLSPVFREAFVNCAGVELELYNTDAAQGAARGAGVGAGVYASTDDAFIGLERILTLAPQPELQEQYQVAYARWQENLNSILPQQTTPQHVHQHAF